MTKYYTIALVFLVSSIPASPLQSGQPYNAIKRQAVPDRYGNTSSRPAFSAPPNLPLPVWTRASTVASSIVPTTTSTGSSSYIIICSPSTTFSSSSVMTLTPSTSPAIPIPRPTPSSSNPWLQFHSTRPSPLMNPATIAGISLGSVAVLALTIGIRMLLRRRTKVREVREITTHRIRPAKPFGAHYNAKIGRSRSWKWRSVEVSDSSVSSWGSVGKNKLIATYKSPVTASPSVYSTIGLRRTTQVSAVTFESVDGWRDTYSQTLFTGTPSQLLDAPRPLFLNGEKMNGGDPTNVIGQLESMESFATHPSENRGGMGHGLGLR